MIIYSDAVIGNDNDNYDDDDNDHDDDDDDDYTSADIAWW